MVRVIMGKKSWKNKKLKKLNDSTEETLLKYPCDYCNQLTVTIPFEYFEQNSREGDSPIATKNNTPLKHKVNDRTSCLNCDHSYSITQYCIDHKIILSKKNYLKQTEKALAEKKQERKLRQETRQLNLPRLKLCPNCNKDGIPITPAEEKSDLLKNPLTKNCKFCDTKFILKYYYPNRTNTAPGHEEYNGPNYRIEKLTK